MQCCTAMLAAGVAIVYLLATVILLIQVVYLRYIRHVPQSPSGPGTLEDVEQPLLSGGTPANEHREALDVPNAQRESLQQQQERQQQLIASSPRSLDFSGRSTSGVGSLCAAVLIFVSTHKLSGYYTFRLNRDQLGEILGWLMALVYFVGRIPQIISNHKHGVKGLSATMFALAIIGNGTYVAAVLVKSTQWKDVKPVFAWIIDAAVCLALDLLILMQYAILHDVTSS